MTHSFLEGRVSVLVGDLTDQGVDAIVNAANSSLLGGGGVDGAIHSRGGPAILAECREIRRTVLPNGLPTGEAVITTAGNLPARHVIHTVGPIYGRNNGLDAELLAACYSNTLALAAERRLASIAYPSISTGVYSFPKVEAARVASAAMKQFLEEIEVHIQVRLVFHTQSDADIFLAHHVF